MKIKYFRTESLSFLDPNLYIYIYIYINYIKHCKTKRDNHQVLKIVRVPGNKLNPKKIRIKFINNANNYCNKYRIH